MVTESNFEPNHRATIVRAMICRTKVQFVNVYLKAGGEPHEPRVTLEWAVPFLLDCIFLHHIWRGFPSKP